MDAPKVEVNERFMPDNGATITTPHGGVVMFTPAISEDYWLARVAVGRTQAVVAFPKFSTIGIGFQHESDWNTNLPYTCSAEEIYDHIEHNKARCRASREKCIDAIKALQAIAPRFLAGDR